MLKKSKRTLKHLLVIIFIVIISIFITKMMDHYETSMVLILALIPMGLIILQLVLKSQLSLKPFFTSKFNILTSKYKLSNCYEIPSELLFDKIIEVLKESGFKNIQSDRAKGLIFAPASISFKSWGENLYFTISKNDENSTMLLFESVAFQLYSWGKNEDNAKEFFNKMEESLII